MVSNLSVVAGTFGDLSSLRLLIGADKGKSGKSRPKGRKVEKKVGSAEKGSAVPQSRASCSDMSETVGGASPSGASTPLAQRSMASAAESGSVLWDMEQAP